MHNNQTVLYLFQHTKRKLDDVSKRLEALYDKLREQKMSNPILEGLHEIAQGEERVSDGISL